MPPTPTPEGRRRRQEEKQYQEKAEENLAAPSAFVVAGGGGKGGGRVSTMRNFQSRSVGIVYWKPMIIFSEMKINVLVHYCDYSYGH